MQKIMKTNKIFKFIAVALASSVLLTGCIEETVRENGNATQNQVTNSPFAGSGILMSVPSIMMSNYSEYIGEPGKVKIVLEKEVRYEI